MTEPAKTPNMQADERDAIAYLGRLREGQMLHRYLRRVLENVPEGAEEAGALQADRGRRSLARDLMRIMASAIEETTSDRPESGANQPILSGANAVSAGRRPTFREHALANDPELVGSGTANRAKPA